MSFQQGLSGLNGAAKSLDVIGNNIANSSTVGFKGSTTQFADVYARSLNGAGGSQAGIGVAVAGIAQQFTQGNIETSANPLDIAINGGGFFRTESSGLVAVHPQRPVLARQERLPRDAPGRQPDRLRRRPERPDPGRFAVAAADQHAGPEAGRHDQDRHLAEPRFARRPADQLPVQRQRPDHLQQADPGRRLRHPRQRARDVDVLRENGRRQLGRVRRQRRHRTDQRQRGRGRAEGRHRDRRPRRLGHRHQGRAAGRRPTSPPS